MLRYNIAGSESVVRAVSSVDAASNLVRCAEFKIDVLNDHLVIYVSSNGIKRFDIKTDAATPMLVIISN